MDIEDEENDIDTGGSFLSKKREKPDEDEEGKEKEESEIKMAEEEQKFIEDKLELLKFTGDIEKKWQDLLKEIEQALGKMEEIRVKELSNKQSNFTNCKHSIAQVVQAMKQDTAVVDDPERTFKWMMDDLDYFISSNKEQDQEYKKENVQFKVSIMALLAIVHDLIKQIANFRMIFAKELIAVKKLGEDVVKLKVATDDRILQVEKPIEKWLKQENKVESPEQKELRENKRKIKEAAKLVRIEQYKREKTWIEKEEWDKLSPGLKAMHRFVFSDVHQNMTFDQWKSLNREKKNEFIEAKRQFRIKRKKELEEIEKIDKEKAEKARRQFNFFQFRVIDRGIVCDLRGIPFQNSQYRKRY